MSDEQGKKGDGTAERVALDLWDRLSVRARQSGETQAAYVERQLALFAQCLNAAKGRTFDTNKLT